jgi:hypothetical protein
LEVRVRLVRLDQRVLKVIWETLERQDQQASGPQDQRGLKADKATREQRDLLALAQQVPQDQRDPKEVKGTQEQREPP